MMITTSSITVPIGWWIIPSLISAYVAAWVWREEIMADPDDGGLFAPSERSLLRALFAAVVALAAWLIWALAR